MRQKTERHQEAADRTIKDIRRQTRRKYTAEDKIRIVLSGLKGEDSIAELCRQEGIAQSQYYSWSKEFLEAGKKRLAGDTMRALGAAAPATRVGQVARQLAAPAMKSAPVFAAQVPAEIVASAGAVGGQKAGGAVGDYFGGETGKKIGNSIGSIAGGLAPAASVAGALKGVRSSAARSQDTGLTSAEINNALQRTEIEPSGGLVGNPMTARAETTASHLPIGGGAVRDKMTRQMGQFQDALQGSASRLRNNASNGYNSPDMIGSNIQQMADDGLNSIKSELAVREGEVSAQINAFNKGVDVGPMVQAGKAVVAGTTPSQGRLIESKLVDLDEMRTHPLDANLDRELNSQAKILEKSIEAKYQKFDQANGIQQRQSIQGELKRLEERAQQVQQQLHANKGVDFDRLRQWRGEIGSRTDAGGVAGANQKQLYKAASERLEHAAGESGVLDQFNSVTQREADLYRTKGSLDDGGDIAGLRTLAKHRDGATSFNYLVEAGKKRPERLELLKRNTSPERWNELSADILEHFGRAKPGRVDANHEFSPNTFLTNWETMSERSKSLLAGPEKGMLDDLATAAKAFRTRSSAGGRSDVVPTVLKLGTFGGLLFEPQTAALALGAGAAAGRTVSSEGLARFLASKAPIMYQRLAPRLTGQLGRELSLD